MSKARFFVCAIVLGTFGAFSPAPVNAESANPRSVCALLDTQVSSRIEVAAMQADETPDYQAIESVELRDLFEGLMLARSQCASGNIAPAVEHYERLAARLANFER